MAVRDHVIPYKFIRYTIAYCGGGIIKPLQGIKKIEKNRKKDLTNGEVFGNLTKLSRSGCGSGESPGLKAAKKQGKKYLTKAGI